MSADRLREAARVLRERAADTTASPWGFAGVQDQGFAVHRGAHDTVALYASRPDAAYIATVHPEVGKALADWLDAEAKHAEKLALQSGALNFLITTSDGTEGDPRWRVSLGYNTLDRALAVADAILGGAS